MDRRETAYDPFDGNFDEKTMTGYFSEYGDEPIPIKCHWEVCLTCNGSGSHVNPAIDSHGLSRDDFDEDPDFEEAYWAGIYDVPCVECGGRRVTAIPNDDDPNAPLWDAAMIAQLQYMAEVEDERRMGA